MIRFVLLLAALGTAVAGVAAGSPASGSAPGISVGAKMHSAGNVTYMFTARFHLEYDVHWRQESGRASGKLCVDHGHNWMDAKNVDRFSGTKPILPSRPKKPMVGRITIYPVFDHSPKALGGWADAFPVGPAGVWILRQWLQDGGSNCTPPHPPADCGTKSGETQSAGFFPQVRSRLATLEDLMKYERGSETQANDVLAFSIPTTISYSTCKTSIFAPQLPLNLAFDVGDKVWSLRRLQAGHTLFILKTDKGACTPHTPTDQECDFRVALRLSIHRLSAAELLRAAHHK